MLIRFVGTSHGVPAPDRFCSCNMITTGGKIYMVDAGAPAIEMLLHYGGDINDFRALFTTHVHGDHTVGMIHLVDLMNWYYKQSSGDFFITEQGLIDSTLDWLKAAGTGSFDSERLHMKVASAGVMYKDENVTAEYIPTAHINNSYAVLMTAEGKRVLFGGDFSQGLRKNDVPEIIKEDIDLFVCEMAHFGIKELTPYLETCRAKRVAFTHLNTEKFADVEALKGKYAFDVLLPSDGDVIEI